MISIPALDLGDIRLRGFGEHDVTAYREIRADPEVARYLPGGLAAVADANARTQAVLDLADTNWRSHGYGIWAVEDMADGTLLGHAGLNHVDELNAVEVLYALAPSAWGRGLATRAARASIAYGFEKAGLDRIVGLVHRDNDASARVLQKAGLAFEEEIDFKELPVLVYAIERPGG